MMKQFIRLLVLFCLALAGATAQQIVHANSELIVQGKITQMDGSPSSSLAVHLIEISMSDQPSIRSVLSVKSDTSGHYTLKYSPDTTNKEKVFYRVSVDFAGQTIGSNPFLPDQSNQPKMINISLPEIKQGIQHLSMPKEVVIVESMEESIRITNVLYIVNPTTALVNAKKIPFEKPIPESASNVRLLGAPTGVEFSVEAGRVLVGLSMPEKSKQVFFSYDLPVGGGSALLEFPLAKNVREVEFTTSEKSLDLKIDESFGTGFELVSQRKKMGGKVFYSQILTMNSGNSSIPITISGVPINQFRLAIPAAVLFVVLMAGLLVYLARRNRA